jgi:hypothetical protein
MAVISALEDISPPPGQLSGLLEPLGQLWQDGRALFIPLAINHMQVSSWGVQMFHLQCGHLGDTKAETDHP